MKLRCVMDGLILPAKLCPDRPRLLAWDGEECFGVEAVEAVFYELVSATREELLGLQQGCYRLLRLATDFRQEE